MAIVRTLFAACVALLIVPISQVTAAAHFRALRDGIEATSASGSIRVTALTNSILPSPHRQEWQVRGGRELGGPGGCPAPERAGQTHGERLPHFVGGTQDRPEPQDPPARPAGQVISPIPRLQELPGASSSCARRCRCPNIISEWATRRASSTAAATRSSTGKRHFRLHALDRPHLQVDPLLRHGRWGGRQLRAVPRQTYRSTFDFGHSIEGRCGSARSRADRLLSDAGPTVRDVVRRYTDLTGKPPLTPLWALGYQQSRWSYMSDAEVRGWQEVPPERFPLDVIWLDIDYQDRNRPFTVTARHSRTCQAREGHGRERHQAGADHRPPHRLPAEPGLRPL